MTTNVVSFVFVDEQLRQTQLPLLFDDDINAYKGSVSIADFKFPLLANLTSLQRMSSGTRTKYEFMFSCDERDLVRVFLYEDKQKMYSDRHKCFRVNERSIYEVLHDNNCDEAMVYFDGSNFDYIYQKDTSSDFAYARSFLTSLPAKIFYVLLLSYKFATVYGWLTSLVSK
jgi:hypothetical protein